MRHVLAVVNHKGGVGKTSTAVNVAACLGEMNQKVLLVDLDPQGGATASLGILDNGQKVLDALQTSTALPLRLTSRVWDVGPLRPGIGGC